MTIAAQKISRFNDNWVSLEEFFKTYATWIDRAGADRQVEFIQQGIEELKEKRGRNVGEKKPDGVSG